MASVLATTADLEDMWRPLQAAETARAGRLLVKASSLLRQKMPYLDARIARFVVDPTDQGGLDPVTVSIVVATMVKRFLSNVEGVAAETAGPFGVTYAIRGEKDVRGEMAVSASDLEALSPYRSKKSRVGSIKTRPHLAPWPYGDLGGPGAGSSAGDSWLAEIGTGLPGSEFPIRSIPYSGDS
jgi:hypothetical protein